MKCTTKKCKVWLATIWFLGSATIFLILVGQSIGDAYKPLTRDVWEWFLPNAVPTLSLIIGILALDAVGRTIRSETVDRFFFSLTVGLSLFYLILITVTILVLPLRSSAPKDKLDLLRMSNLWLGPLQGLVIASLGVFFTSKPRTDSKQTMASTSTAPSGVQLAPGNPTP